MTTSTNTSTPAGIRARRRGAGRGARGGESLARRIERTWRSLGQDGSASCPVCGSGMDSGGDCGDCGARLC